MCQILLVVHNSHHAIPFREVRKCLPHYKPNLLPRQSFLSNNMSTYQLDKSNVCHTTESIYSQLLTLDSLPLIQRSSH